MKDKSIHKTSTGKVFQLFDENEFPIDYKEGKDIFSKSYIAGLEVGQILKSKQCGYMLKRITSF